MKYGQMVLILNVLMSGVSFSQPFSYPLQLINCKDAELALRHKKGKGIPIVFIHGSWDDHSSWLPVASQLTQFSTNPIILYDRRGHSASPTPKGQGSIWQDVDDAGNMIETLGYKSAIIVGHSYGANIAIGLAERYPGNVNSLVLYEPPLFGLLRGIPEYVEILSASKKALESSKTLLEKGEIEQGTILFMEEVAFGKGSWEDALDDRMRHMFLSNYATWLDQSKDKSRLEIGVEHLLPVQKEVTIMYGDKSLPIFQGVILELKKRLPDSRFKELPGASHAGIHTHRAPITDMLKLLIAK
ncbi:MAG: alpha/beta hydrolase [Bacteroidota bacterium]